MEKQTKKQNIVPLKDLNLTSRFLFDEVMENPEIHQEVLSIILDREIPLLSKNQTEKEMRVSPLIRSIRMDVFAMDSEKIVYNTEMQEYKRTDLAKRSRYYQALMDTNLLEPGIPDYNKLNDSYIIMVMPYDLFGYGKYCYTFETKCIEVPECVLADGATRIFLNTKGMNDDEVSKELVDFLHYVEDTTDENAVESGSERIKHIHERVCKVKKNEKVGVKYMQAWEEKYYAKQEAREEGLTEGRMLGLELGRAEGREEGRAEGRAEGREEGRAEGRAEELKDTISKMRSKGMSVEVIADILELSIDFILEILDDIS